MHDCTSQAGSWWPLRKAIGPAIIIRSPTISRISKLPPLSPDYDYAIIFLFPQHLIWNVPPSRLPTTFYIEFCTILCTTVCNIFICNFSFSASFCFCYLHYRFASFYVFPLLYAIFKLFAPLQFFASFVRAAGKYLLPDEF